MTLYEHVSIKILIFTVCMTWLFKAAQMCPRLGSYMSLNKDHKHERLLTVVSNECFCVHQRV